MRTPIALLRVKLPLALFLLSASLLAQSKDSAVQGHILDAQGRVLSQAEVRLQNTLSGSTQSMRTNPDGTYSFLNVATGDYNLIASANGLASQVRAVHVKDGQSPFTVDIL